VVNVFSNPAAYNETITKLGKDAGAFILKSQTTISASIERIKADGDLSIMERQFLNGQILGSIAFTLLLILLSMSIIGFLIRGKEASLVMWLAVFIVSLSIIGVLQVIASYTVTGNVIFPYQGFIDILKNLDVVWSNFMYSIPPSINVSVEI